MSDSCQELRRIHWGECLGITSLFRAFRLSLHPTKILLALCGVLLTYFSGRLLDATWAESHQPIRVTIAGRAQTELDKYTTGIGIKAVGEWRQKMIDKIPVKKTGNKADKKLDKKSVLSPDFKIDVKYVGVFQLVLNGITDTMRQATEAVLKVSPRGLLSAVHHGILVTVWLVRMHPLYAALFVFINLVIWAFFGGAICRVAALHTTRDERLNFRDALAFSRQKFLSFLAAPLLPVLGLLIITVLLWLGGLVGAIKGLGDIVAPLFFFLALLAGFAMAFITIGLAAGWPLMYPTIAVEGSDAFDAFSRTFSYIYQRSWKAAFYGLVSLAYGMICILFVKFFFRIALIATHFAVGLSMNYCAPFVAKAESPAAEMGKLDAMWQAPSLAPGLSFWGGYGSHDLVHVSRFGQFFIHLWLYLLLSLIAAFVITLFFNSSTLIYLLLRRDVDATDLDEVYLEEKPNAVSSAPLAGAAETKPSEAPEVAPDSPPA